MKSVYADDSAEDHAAHLLERHGFAAEADEREPPAAVQERLAA